MIDVYTNPFISPSITSKQVKPLINDTNLLHFNYNINSSNSYIYTLLPNQTDGIYDLIYGIIIFITIKILLIKMSDE